MKKIYNIVLLSLICCSTFNTQLYGSPEHTKRKLTAMFILFGYSFYRLAQRYNVESEVWDTDGYEKYYDPSENFPYMKKRINFLDFFPDAS